MYDMRAELLPNHKITHQGLSKISKVGNEITYMGKALKTFKQKPCLRIRIMYF